MIGTTGVGKSCLGNSLLGKDHFYSSAAAKSVTSKCEIGESDDKKRNIKVADTPGIINADGKNMMSVMQNFFEFLAPGPHAIIIVLAPNRESETEKRALAGLRDFFGDDNFLNYTMLVMVRKNEIIGDYGESENIHEFIENKSADNVKQLYAECNKRIIAVENKQSMTERQKQAEEVFEEIDKMDGFYDHRYFKLLANVREKDSVIVELEKKINLLETKKTILEEIDELNKKRQVNIRNQPESKCSIF